MAEGGFPPPAPTDPDVPDSGIRLLGPWHRYAETRTRAPRFRRRSANCRTCVETAVGSVSSPSVRPAVHDPIRRFPPPGPRGAGSPTSSVLSADSDFSTPVPAALRFPSLGGTTRCPVRSRGSGPLPRAGTAVYRGPSVPHLRWRRRDLPGSWATPACMPRSPTPAEPHAPDHLGGRDGAFRSCHSVRLPRCLRISWLNHAACKAPCVRFAAGVAPVHATLGSGWSVNLGRSGLSPAGSHRRFLSCHNMPSPFTKLRLAQDKPVPYKPDPTPCVNSRQDLVGATLVVARPSATHIPANGTGQARPLHQRSNLTRSARGGRGAYLACAADAPGTPAPGPRPGRSPGCGSAWACPPPRDTPSIPRAAIPRPLA